MVELSVIVSTFNRGNDIDNLLASLSNQKQTRDESLEIVISNNGSTDNTEEIIQKYANSSRIPIHYVYQPRNAKSFGLNAAVSQANGKIIAFTDDDIILPETWVDSVVKYFADHPNTSCIGGPVVLYNKKDLDTSTRNSQEYAIYTKTNFNPTFIPVIGCNMVLSRSIIKSIGVFDILFGPGSFIGSGDDLDYIYRILSIGSTINYVPEIWVYHNHGRKNPSDLKKIKRRYLIGRGAFYGKYLTSDKFVLRWAYWEILFLSKRHWYRWIFNRDSRIQMRYLLWIIIGFIKWHLRLFRSEK